MCLHICDCMRVSDWLRARDASCNGLFRARVRSDEWKSLSDGFPSSPLFVSLKFDVSRWSWASLPQKRDPLWLRSGGFRCVKILQKSTWQIHSWAETGFSSSSHSSSWSAGMRSGWSSAGFWIQEWCSDAFPSNPSDRHRGSPNAPPSPHVPEDPGIRSHRRASVSRGF